MKYTLLTFISLFMISSSVLGQQEDDYAYCYAGSTSITSPSFYDTCSDVASQPGTWAIESLTVTLYVYAYSATGLYDKQFSGYSSISTSGASSTPYNKSAYISNSMYPSGNSISDSFSDTHSFPFGYYAKTATVSVTVSSGSGVSVLYGSAEADLSLAFF